MADMKKEFEKLGSNALEVFTQFIGFFTVKRVLTTLIVCLALFVVCSPRDNYSPNTSEQNACDGSCPLREAGTPIHSEVLSQENWSFTLVGAGWTPKESPTPEIKAALENHDQQCMIFVVKEQTTDSYGQYVISTIRSFAQMGAIIDTVKMVVINGQKFVLTQVDNNMEVVWVWVTVKDGYGYGFTCGCDINPDAGTAQQTLCHSMANSFQIK